MDNSTWKTVLQININMRYNFQLKCDLLLQYGLGWIYAQRLMDEFQYMYSWKAALITIYFLKIHYGFCLFSELRIEKDETFKSVNYFVSIWPKFQLQVYYCIFVYLKMDWGTELARCSTYNQKAPNRRLLQKCCPNQNFDISFSWFTCIY